MERSLPERRQAIVVGAGPAGAATAFFLGRAGIDVLLLDKARFPRDKTCGDAVSPRALGVLGEMGLLDEVSARAQRCDEVCLVAPNHHTTVTAVPRPPGLPDHVLVIKRLHFDHMVQRRAVAAGAEFRVEPVRALLQEGGAVVGVRLDGDRSVRADLVVLATGAAMPLLKDAGLLDRKPEMILAARRYYDEIPEVEPRLEFYFDHVDLPGYGWLFPAGPHSANVGIGYMGTVDGSPLSAFARFVDSHPRLRSLARARPDGAVRGYPLRVDFPRARKTGSGVLAVGEAVGLVNPFTGEGIDYALESGRIAGETIAPALREGGGRLAEGLRAYEKALDARFRRLFVVLTLARRAYFNGPMLNRVLGGAPARKYLVDTLLEVCLGTLDPLRALGPRALFELLRP